MVFENIEQLKRDFTDKYVVVDVERPELRRFEGQTGVVKTVNMNGNALVEFDGLNNIGWFDIGLDFLKVVDKPIPKEEPKKAPAKKAPAKKAAKPAAKKEPAKAAGGGGKMSVADMLAAARGEKSEGGAAAEPAAAAEKPAPAKAGGKMSVADMLAAARGEKSGGGAAAAAPAEAAPAPAPEPEPEPVAEAPAAAPAGDLPKDTEGICAYCRKVDA